MAAIDPEARVRLDHPLRAVRRMADQAPGKTSRRSGAAYAPRQAGPVVRPSG